MKTSLLTYLLSLCFVTIAISQTTFKAKQIINGSTGNAPYTIASGQINNDAGGYIDVVIGTYLGNTIEVYINSNGTFPNSPVLVTNTLDGIVGLKLVDIDGVNGLDILVTAYTNNKVTWYPNDGSGNFTTEHIISSTTLGASGLAFGDIDDDGTIDVAATSYDGNNVIWFENDGIDTDGFSSANTIDNTLSQPGSVNLTDIDNDGDLDVIVTTAAWPIASVDLVQIFRNDLYPSGAGVVSWTKITPSIDSGLTYMFNAIFVDLDGDSNLDILATEVENTNGAGDFFYYEDGNTDPFDSSAFSKTVWTTTIGNPAAAQLHDLDDDGLKDIILSNGNQVASSNQIVWFRKTGAGVFATETVIDATQSQTFVYTVFDFDKDGDLDIVSCSYGSDDLTLFENEKYTLGLNENSIRKISIYPNPTTDKLFFKGLFNDNFKVSVFDILGKLIIKKSLNSKESLDVSQLHSGIYIIRYDDYNATYKFVKK